MKQRTFGLVVLSMLFISLPLLGPAAESQPSTPTLGPEKGWTHYWIPFDQLKLTEGEWPAATTETLAARGRLGARRLVAQQFYHPYVVLDGRGEAFLDNFRPEDARDPRFQRLSFWWDRPVRDLGLAARIPEGAALRGRLFLPKPDVSGMVMVRFAVEDAPTTQGRAREQFLKAKEHHYTRLLQADIPGAAWFRHQARRAQAERLGRPATVAARQAMPGQQREIAELDRTYNLFTGGRALSENLQLDRLLAAPAQAGTQTITLETIEGITVAEFNWKPLIENLKPELDPLAARIPADQHAIFFPSFAAMIQLIDEAKANGTPVLRALEPSSGDAETSEWYERQLCLPPDTLSRLLGPQLVASVAFTGSDPYLRTGSDVAVLFEAKNAAALRAAIASRHAAALEANADAKAVEGDLDGVAYTGALSPGRVICSYMAVIDNAVVVTNSLAQLGRLVETAKGKIAPLRATDEYVFFRDRYPRADGDHLAVLILTDATIRRWCGPRWRIGASRRTRMAAVMAELQAEHLDALAAGQAQPRDLATTVGVLHAGPLRLTPHGVASEVYGTLDFQTPILEIPIEEVTKAEADGYTNFRRNYQNNWRRFFDPIAIRFAARPDRVAVDLTVIPLILGSDYREFIAIAGQGNITPAAGDPHPEAIGHAVLSFDANAPPVREVADLASQMAPALRANALGWLGKTVALYADADPFWQELAKFVQERKNEDWGEFFEENIARLPVALRVDVSNALILTAFLTSLRAFIEQTAPGMTIWETRTHKDRPYVRVAPSPQAQQDEKFLKDLAVYYAPMPGGLTLSLNEEVIKRAVERQGAATTGTTPAPVAAPKPDAAWLGKHLALLVRAPALDLIRALTADLYQIAMQRRAWGAIPILNEWRRLYPEQSPVEFHKRWWQVELTGPTGGGYVWNEKWQTMESVVYGHPAEPKEGPATPAPLATARSANFGLTFEHEGLRTRAEVTRAK